MRQVLMSSAAGVNSGSVVFIAVNNSSFGNNGSTSTADYLQIAASSGTFSLFRVTIVTAPGAGKSRTFTLNVNGSDTALSVTISDTATSGQDNTNSVNISAGDIVKIKCTPAGTPAASGVVRHSLIFTGTTSKESLILAGSGTPNVLANNADQFVQVSGNWLSASTTETDCQQVVATSGTIKNLYMGLGTACGIGKSRTFTLFKNGLATALTVTFSDGDVAKSDTTNLVSVVAGDTLSLQSAPVSTPASAAYSMGLTFLADIDGESLILGGSQTTPANNATNYAPVILSDGVSQWNATESSVSGLGQTCILRKFIVVADTAPGSGKNYTFDLRINAASPVGTLSAQVADLNLTASDLTNAVTIQNDDLVAIRSVPSGTPTADNYRWGIAQFIEPSTFIPEIDYV